MANATGSPAAASATTTRAARGSVVMSERLLASGEGVQQVFRTRSAVERRERSARGRWPHRGRARPASSHGTRRCRDRPHPGCAGTTTRRRTLRRRRRDRRSQPRCPATPPRRRPTARRTGAVRTRRSSPNDGHSRKPRVERRRPQALVLRPVDAGEAEMLRRRSGPHPRRTQPSASSTTERTVSIAMLGRCGAIDVAQAAAGPAHDAAGRVGDGGQRLAVAGVDTQVQVGSPHGYFSSLSGRYAACAAAISS